MFQKGEIWAFPTDTSFGLGVRADDEAGLQRLAELKDREKTKYFSLMVRDLEMLKQYAEVPENISEDFFTKKPTTAILKAKKKLPLSAFWPQEGVAFRITTLPSVAQHITYPVTATSANISGTPPIFDSEELKKTFGNTIHIFSEIKKLPETDPSEIWDLRQLPAKRIR